MLTGEEFGKVFGGEICTGFVQGDEEDVGACVFKKCIGFSL